MGEGYKSIEEMMEAFDEQLPEPVYQEFKVQIKWSNKNNTFGYKNFFLTRGFDLQLHFIDIWKGKVIGIQNSVVIYFLNE